MSFKELDEFLDRQGIKSAELCKIIDSIELQLNKAQEDLIKANKVIRYYANRDNWRQSIPGGRHDSISTCDTENLSFFRSESCYFGGKRARSHLVQSGEVLDVKWSICNT